VILYTNLMPSRFNGFTIGFLILIRPSRKGNLGLIAHEKIHVRLFWRTVGVGGLLSLISKKLRLKYEVEAYREQLKFNPTSAELYAEFISTKYGLNISKEDALALLLC
jgi:hypothetical protein